MEVIGEDNLKEYATKHQNARCSLARWLTLTKHATWRTFQDVKASFPAADYIPHNRYCFNIGGNNYRLMTAISFRLGIVTVLDFMTHAEYLSTRG